VEGIHGEAKTWHGLARAVRRGLANMQIQADLTAAVINLKRLAAALLAILTALWPPEACYGREQRPAELIALRVVALAKLAST
jgi:hypothetical protein